VNAAPPRVIVALDARIRGFAQLDNTSVGRTI
jgi:hypothetical protein